MKESPGKPSQLNPRIQYGAQPAPLKLKHSASSSANIHLERIGGQISLQRLNGNPPIQFDHSNLESLINKQKKQLDKIVNIRSVKDINIYNNSFIVNQPPSQSTTH